MSTDTIYVAGHRGLIGSAVMRALQAGGRQDVVVRNHEDLELQDARSVDAFFGEVRPAFVVMAAGRVGGIVANRDHPADFLAENLAIQSNVLLAAHRTGAKRVLFFASSCMYPRECPQPMAEDALLSGKPEPTSMAYATAKMAGTELCLALNRQHGRVRFLPLIPNSVYGPNDDFDPATGHVLSSLVRKFHDARQRGERSVQLWGSGSPRREFLHADDLAAACLLLLSTPLDTVKLPLNIGPGEDVSIAELAATVARIVGFEGAIEWDRSKPDGAPRKLLDSARMRALGWKPSVKLEDGIRSTYDWYLSTQRGRLAA